MELVEGRTLSAVVAAGPMPAEQVVRLGAQLADALAHAHDRVVVHRDLKSNNIIVTPDGRAKVLDFGLAKRSTSADLAVTYLQVSLTLHIGGGVAYSLPRADLFISYTHYVSGTDTHVGRAITTGFSVRTVTQ